MQLTVLFFAAPIDRHARAVPYTEAAEECIGIVAGAASSRHLLQLHEISVTYDDILGFSCRDQSFDHILNKSARTLLTDAVETPLANIIFVCALLVGQVADFHRLDNAVHDHRRAESRSQF